MNFTVTSGDNDTYWLESLGEPLKFQNLNKNLTTEIVIVGGGIAGISIAYFLMMSGKKVVVLEDGFIGSGETGRSSAQLVTALDDKYYHLQKLWGLDDVKLIAQSHRQAIDDIETIVERHKIECLFEKTDGYMFAHPTERPEALREEFAAAQAAGVDVSWVDSVPGAKGISGPALVFHHQAQFHPLLYLKHLCLEIIKGGGKIYSGTHVDQIQKGSVVAGMYTVEADAVVVATNSPVHTRILPHIKQVPYRTYVVGGLIPRGSLPKAMWWDTGNMDVDPHFPPYHFVRVLPYSLNEDLVLIGGEDHPTGDEKGKSGDERYASLQAWGAKHFDLQNVKYRWSGQVLQSIDSIGYIGRTPLGPDSVYLVTGDSGTGITLATIAARLITDLIDNKNNPYEQIYSPGRMSVQVFGTLFSELMRSFHSAFINNHDRKSVDNIQEIQKEEGRLVTINGHKCGVYKDYKGVSHIVQARCTHMGALLTWNENENTWDCPWHGSRFSKDGEVLNGPANSPLEKIIL